MLKPVEWTGSSKADLKHFPDPVRARMGFAIYQAQIGLRHRDAKPLKGFGSGVLEVVSRYDGDTLRAVYTVRFETAVHVLHAFRKKAKRGTATPVVPPLWLPEMRPPIRSEPPSRRVRLVLIRRSRRS